ncbi:hypothetical protein BV25DRAFT_408727 [Artomyces pyxidatus]|uniref:Uncharacterized protein n=1 Tax=Artomyces pyxidatus TaxID=48021 RepID=A0ACB8T553_9AGAM|nr:hypothetical protein BV25DRAFT_408727 [Artomyces pyxidatus]
MGPQPMGAFTAVILCCLLLLPTTDATPTIGSDDQAQKPFVTHHGAAWDSPPHPDSTNHLIFNNVNSLMQRWPNTMYLNGHSIVAATIPTGTILYHGRRNETAPTGHEWLAFDFEHSYMFCLAQCYVISYMVTRDLRLAYLDGVSAANLRSGTYDTQDILIWGKPRPDKVMAEQERITGICEWGKQYGLDGFVRMEFHFEVMLCDFSAGSVEIVSLLSLLPKNFTNWRWRRPRDPPESPRYPGSQDNTQRLGFDPSDPPRRRPQWPWPPLPTPPPGWKGSLPDGPTADLQALIAGSWHDRAPGETRHRLINITESDTTRKLAELADVFRRAPGAGSGVDWGSVTHVVLQRYADRLALLRFLLAPAPVDAANVTEHAALVRTQLLTMLAPYMTTDAVPTPGNASWAEKIVRLCATTHTARIRDASLTPQERVIRDAVEGTAREICRRLTLMWVDAFDIEGAAEAKQHAALLKWRVHVSELMAWLDWSVWARCDPECRPDVRVPGFLMPEGRLRLC